MRKVPFSVLTCDHTFKDSKPIGVVRETDSSFVNQLVNLFIVLNEIGQVLDFRLTKSTSFSEIEEVVQELKAIKDAKRRNR